MHLGQGTNRMKSVSNILFLTLHSRYMDIQLYLTYHW